MFPNARTKDKIMFAKVVADGEIVDWPPLVCILLVERELLL